MQLGGSFSSLKVSVDIKLFLSPRIPDVSDKQQQQQHWKRYELFVKCNNAIHFNSKLTRAALKRLSLRHFDLRWILNRRPLTENSINRRRKINFSAAVTSSDRPCQCTLRKLHQILWIEFNFIAFVSLCGEDFYRHFWQLHKLFFLLLRFIRSRAKMEFMICEGRNGLRWIPSICQNGVINPSNGRS